MTTLALRMLRVRPGGMIASFVALFLGAAVVMIGDGLMETGIRADVPPQRLAGASIVVNGQQEFDSEPLAERARLDAGLADRLAALPGVAAAVQDVSVPAALIRGDGTSLQSAGHGWSSAALGPYRLTSGHAPTAPGQVILDTALAARYGVRDGGTIRVQVPTGLDAFQVVGTVAATPDLPSALFFTDAEAQALLGRPGQVDSIALRTLPGVDPGARVADRAGVTAAFARQQQAQKWMTTLFVGGISGYTVISLVNTLVVATGNRRREFALQRLIGSTRGQVLRMLAVESVFVAVAGMVLGTAVAVLTVTTRFPLSTWGPAWIYPVIAASALGLTLLSSLTAAGVALRGRPIQVAATHID